MIRAGGPGFGLVAKGCTPDKALDFKPDTVLVLENHTINEQTRLISHFGKLDPASVLKQESPHERVNFFGQKRIHAGKP